MWSFRKNKPSKVAERPALIAEVIVKQALAVQGKWAGWMNKHFNGYPLRTKKFLFFCLLIVGGTYFSVTLFSVYSHQNPLASIPGPEAIPLKAAPSTPLPAKDSLIVERILRFNQYLKILDQSPAGKKKKDSLLKSRPGLTDSLEVISEWYEQHHANLNNY